MSGPCSRDATLALNMPSARLGWEERTPSQAVQHKPAIVPDAKDHRHAAALLGANN